MILLTCEWERLHYSRQQWGLSLSTTTLAPRNAAAPQWRDRSLKLLLAQWLNFCWKVFDPTVATSALVSCVAFHFFFFFFFLVLFFFSFLICHGPGKWEDGDLVVVDHWPLTSLYACLKQTCKLFTICCIFGSHFDFMTGVLFIDIFVFFSMITCVFVHLIKKASWRTDWCFSSLMG